MLLIEPSAGRSTSRRRRPADPAHDAGHVDHAAEDQRARSREDASPGEGAACDIMLNFKSN